MHIKRMTGALLLMGVFGGGCYKSSSMPGAASLTVVNAMYNSNNLYTNFLMTTGSKAPDTLKYYVTAGQVPTGGSAEFNSFYGQVSLALSQTDDTTASVWSGVLNCPIGSITTLFLAGDTTQVDTLFTTDVVPYYAPADSSAGVRFVNLSTGSLPMSVNIKGNPGTQTEFANLGYRQISAFKGYPAISSVGGRYSFEIRDQATDSVLTTFNWRYTLGKSQTIVIYGPELYGVSVFTVNEY